jgi:hypothetical protein
VESVPDLAARTGIALSTVVFRTRKMIAAGDVRRAVELRLGTSPVAVQAGIADLVRALDAEIKERRAS